MCCLNSVVLRTPKAPRLSSLLPFSKKCPTLLHQAAVARVALGLRLARCCFAVASQCRHCGKGNHAPRFVSLRRSLLMWPAGFKISKRLITDPTLNVRQKQTFRRSVQSGGRRALATDTIQEVWTLEKVLQRIVNAKWCGNQRHMSPKLKTPSQAKAQSTNEAIWLTPSTASSGCQNCYSERHISSNFLRILRCGDPYTRCQNAAFPKKRRKCSP